MGLLSYFRNRKLKKADRLFDEGRLSEAEHIYTSLVYKHPQAACKLAAYYLKLSSSYTVNDDVSVFLKVFEIKNNVKIYEPESFNQIFSEYTNHIRTRAIECFKSNLYEDCCSLTSVLEETNNNTMDDSILGSEAKIRLLYDKIISTNLKDDSFNSLIESFRKEWNICKEKQRAKDSAIQFCQSLIDSKRYYVSNLLLSLILNNTYDKKCLDNAKHIINGEDSEATPILIKSVISNYAKALIICEERSKEEAVEIFRSCWEASNNPTIVMDVLKSANNVDLRTSLIEEMISNHSTYLSFVTLFDIFTKWIYEDFEGKESLKLLERIHDLGYDVEKYYTQKTHLFSSELPIEQRIPYLDHAQNMYPDSTLIIEDKLKCSQEYLDNKENGIAIAISDSIINKNENAKLIKTQALINFAKSTTEADKKIEFLNQAKSVLETYKGSESKTIEDILNEEFVKTADVYYKENKRDKTYTLLNSLAKNGIKIAAIAYASYRLSEIREIRSIEKRQQASHDAIFEINELGISSIPDENNYQGIWDEYISSTIKNSKKLDNSSAITVYENLLKEIELIGFNTIVLKDKTKPVIKHLIERKYLVARDLELSMNFSDASDLYKEINAFESKKMPTLAAIRFIICKLKIQNNNDILEHRTQIFNILRKAAAAFKSEKDEIAYRFALILLKSGEDQEALDVLEEFLPDEEYLKKACKQGTVIKALAKIDDFNNKLDSVKNRTLSSDDALYFINHMLEYAEIIKPVLSLPLSILSKYRNKLKNYAIYKLFDEERYDVAFEKMLKEHKDYLDDYTALRNIAIVCLYMAESNQVTKSNYNDVISIWLTAIYQEKIFVNSLDYTSWDDPYTFSLYEAYGHFNEDSIGTLPDNVTMDYSDEDNVVPIKEVQRTLLDRFEAAISENQQFHEFYTFQKDAMDSFIALNLDDKCRIIAPYLAHKNHDLFLDISNALEGDRKPEHDNWEDLLSVGAIYQMPQSIYKDYGKAKSYYEECISTINTVNTNIVNQAFLSSKVELIKKFGKLFSALKSYSNSKISALSANNKKDFKNNYNFYLAVCSSLKDKTLSFVFSNFVMQYVVGEVNADSMKKSEAASYILSIFALDKNNSRVKENLTTLFEMLARDDSSDSTKAVTNILERVRNLDTSLYNQLKNEYEQAKIDKELKNLVDKLTNHSISESAALQKIYSLYTGNSNNDDICEILAQLCVACIMKYIIHQEYGGSSATNILGQLENNMSSTFKKHRSHFKQAHDSIWNSLPSDAKSTLQGLNPHATLNSSGLALKQGLNWFQKLGGFAPPSSISDIFGLF